jgi:hypothetical protein
MALYLIFWGLAGIAMGNLLPWIDSCSDKEKTMSALHAVEWSDVVRSIGAFVGIAFAIVSLESLPRTFVRQLTILFSVVFLGKQHSNSLSLSHLLILSFGISSTVPRLALHFQQLSAHLAPLPY